MSLLTALLSLLSCSPVANLDADDFDTLAAEPNVFLIDVRTPEEYAEGHLRGASNIDWIAPDFLEQVASACPKGEEYVIAISNGRQMVFHPLSLYKVLPLSVNVCLAW